jgi:hypothetical protein
MYCTVGVPYPSTRRRAIKATKLVRFVWLSGTGENQNYTVVYCIWVRCTFLFTHTVNTNLCRTLKGTGNAILAPFSLYLWIFEVDFQQTSRQFD